MTMPSAVRTASPVLVAVLFAACARTPLKLQPDDSGTAPDGAASAPDSGAVTGDGGDAGDAGPSGGDGGGFTEPQIAWQTTFRISDADAGYASFVAVAPRATGNTDVVWSTSLGGTTSFWATRMDPDAGVTSIQRFAFFDVGVIINPRVTSTASLSYAGATFLHAASLDAGVPRELWAARRTEALWSSPMAIGFGGGSVTFPSLAQFSADAFLATWTTYTSPGSLRTSKSDGPAPMWVESGALNAGNPLMMGAATTDDGIGNAVTAMNNCSMMGQMSCQVTVQWNGGSGWQTPSRADTLGGEIWSSPFVAARNGQATVAWLRKFGGFGAAEFWVTRCSINNGCPGPQGSQSLAVFYEVNPEFLLMDGPRDIDVQMNAVGDALILYAEKDAGVFMSHAGGLSGAFTPPTKLADRPADRPVGAPRTGSNNFAAVWRNGDGGVVVLAWVGAQTTSTNVGLVPIFNQATTVTDLKLAAVGTAVLAVWVADGVVWGIWAK